MNKKTKIGIVILIIVLIIAIAVVVIAFINPFNKETGTEALNDTQVNAEINNTETNNVENNTQENNVVNEEESNIEDAENEEEQQETPPTSDNANNSNEEKAIQLVKNEWGEDSSVYFDLAGVTADGKYRVSVNKDTKVLAWYIVDVENGTVTQK